MLTTEELYLLLTKPNGDAEVPGLTIGPGLVAAILHDLDIAGRLTVTDETTPRVQVLSTEPTGVLLLDFALGRLPRSGGRTLLSTVHRHRLDPELLVTDSLAEAGLLKQGARRRLGFGRHRFRHLDPSVREQIRERIAAVHAGEVEPGPNDAGLLAVLKALTVATQVLGHPVTPATTRQVDERVDVIVGQAPPPRGAVARALARLAIANAGGPAMPPAIHGDSGAGAV